jgi:hypothetical protein
MIKTFKTIIITFCLTGIIPLITWAGETGHYPLGVEGVKGSTMPGPGFYYKMYNYFYTSDNLKDGNGHKQKIGFDAETFLNANRFIWVTDLKIMGGDYFADFVIPVVYSDVEIDDLGIKDNSFSLGDIFLEPFGLAWHGDRYDVLVAAGVFIPTGHFNPDNTASPGKGFFTGQFTAGVTYYMDSAKTWSFSLLNRYEIHTRKRDIDIRPGDNFLFEWGLAKSLPKDWEIGLAGYCQWQVTDDSGSDVTGDKNVHDRVFSAGPEVIKFIPEWKLNVSVRTQWEFDAKDRAEGSVINITFVKIF